MADSVKKQQGKTGKPGRPKGSTTKKETAGSSRAKKQNTVSAGRSSSSRKVQEPVYEEDDMGFMRAEVIIICSFAVAILLFLSNFGLCGIVGEILKGMQLGLFGILGYLLPLLIFIGTCFYLSNQGNIHAAVKLGAVIVAVLTLCGLFQLLFGKMPQDGPVTQFYIDGAAGGAGGGLIGGALASALMFFVGRAGAYLVFLVLLIICMVCITGKSFVSAVKRGSDRAYRYAREDMDRRKEIHAQKAEERKLLREEQRVRGVNLNATRLTAMEEGRRPVPEDAEYDEEAFQEAFAGQPAAAKERQPEENTADETGYAGIMDNEPEEGPDERIEDKPSATGRNRVVYEEEEEIPSPADEFRGRIQMPSGYDNLKDEAQALADELEAQYETIHVPKDRRTLEEMEIPAPDLSSGRATAWEQKVSAVSGKPVPQEEPVPKELYTVSVEDTPWDEDLSEETVSLSDIENEDELGEKKTHTIQMKEYEKKTQDIYADIKADAEDDTEEESPWDPKFDDSTAPDPLMAASGAIYVPEAPKQVVTASGKVIDAETDLLKKKLESTRAAEAAAAPKPDPFMASRSSNVKTAITESEGESAASVAREISKQEVEKEYIFPPTDLLKKPVHNSNAFSENEYKATAIKLQQTLHNFGVGVTVTNISCGPSVTRYELLPEQGVKVSKIVGLTDDIKLSLAAADIRIEAPIPGKSAVGIEVPNKENNIVYLRELLDSDSFKNHKSRLAFAVGKDIGGQVVVTDIAKMPHLLIAGATGSGKSVCINTLIMSIIFKSDPKDVKMIMVDPKVVELSVYNGIPHLLIPVVTDPKKASGALNWAVAEMTDRYKKFADCNVRDLKGYNEKIDKLADIPDDKKPKKLPQIVIIIDELADLMMVAPGEVEDSICRLAQLARAAGIHLVIATQRPSVNVITGLIKANVPSRIAFAVSSGVDSRTIIDMNGAEKLLGKGDMLFYPAGFPKPQRVQGAFVSDEEVGRVVEFLTEQGLTAQYSEDVINRVAAPSSDGGSSAADQDEYFAQAGKFIIEKDKASIGMLQRVFKIGFNRAARIMDQLAEAGVVGEEEGTKPRKVLMSLEQFEELLEQGR